MTPLKLGEMPTTLDPWGTVADLGSEILEGEGRASGKMIFGAPDAPVSCGYFSCTRSRFRMVYPFSEHATVVDGVVTLTDERTGAKATYGAGDSWFIEKGTPVLWEVGSDSFTKSYFAVV